MTRTTSRLGAAFFVSVGIILALAATVLWFAMPVKVQAQSDLCVPTETFIDALASAHERGMSAVYGDPV